MNERVAIWIAAALECAAFAAMLPAALRRARGPSIAIALLGVTVGMLIVAIALRWVRLGHGPFLSMFEILLSNVFSLTTVLLLATLADARVRAVAAFAMPAPILLTAWLLTTPNTDTILPPTYQTPVLWLHVAASKLFLGLCLVALGLALAAAARDRNRAGLAFTAADLDQVAWRFMTAAVAAQTLLLVAGAWWAQDAWGRYWDWDPLEAWAFVTWAVAVAALHARVAYARTPARSATWIAVVFVLAFWTFFGIPFVSTAPHKGAV